MKFRLLTKDEIDVRVGTANDKGVSLLLYKDARCDQNILDETVGPFNWQRHHSRDNANCTVALWDSEKGQWVEKEDTGTESNTEKEKGLASDSFKRACFNWGIGRELYTSPFMWFGIEEVNHTGNKVYETFKVTDIQYSERNISSVTILAVKSGKVKTFSNKKAAVSETKNIEPEDLPTEKKEPEKPANLAVKRTAISKFLSDNGIPIEWLLRKLKIEKWDDLNEELTNYVLTRLETIKKTFEEGTK